MDEQNYYQEIVAKINHFISLEKWNDALILVKDELSAPYIPREYEKKFHSLLSSITSNIKQVQPPRHEWNISKIATILASHDNEEVHLMAFYYLQNQNVRLILPVIKDYLLDKRWSNSNKVRLLFMLKAQELNQVITVVKSDGTYAINPMELVAISKNETYLKVKEILAKTVLAQNVSQYNVAKYLLKTYFENLVPQNISISDANELAAAIYIRTCSFFMIKITLLTSAKLFAAKNNLIKHYLKSLQTYQIT